MTNKHKKPDPQSELPAERKTRAQIRPFTLRLGTAAPALDMSPENLRTKIENGEIAAVRSGKLLLITTEEIEGCEVSETRGEG